MQQAYDVVLGFYDVVLGFDDVVLGFDDVVLCFDDVVLCFDDVMRSRHDVMFRFADVVLCFDVVRPEMDVTQETQRGIFFFLGRPMRCRYQQPPDQGIQAKDKPLLAPPRLSLIHI